MNKIFLKFFQKPIDKSLSIWYNIITTEESQEVKENEKIIMD